MRPLQHEDANNHPKSDTQTKELKRKQACVQNHEGKQDANELQNQSPPN